LLLGRLRVVGGDLPVVATVEHACVDELELRLEATAAVVDELHVRKLRVWVHIPPPHPRVRWGRVEGPPVLLGILPVVALRAGEAEDALLEERVASVPEREGKAEDLPVVADAGKAVLVPAVGPRPRLVVGERVPRLAGRAVVLADRPPRALGQVGAPVP